MPRRPPPIRWPSVTVRVTMSRMPNDHNHSDGISARLVSLSAEAGDPPGLNDYDSFAEGYTAANEASLANAYYERPAMLALGPLHAMTDAFTAAGFRISIISEPTIAQDTPLELLPDDITDGRRFLCFLFFVLHAN